MFTASHRTPLQSCLGIILSWPPRHKVLAVRKRTYSNWLNIEAHISYLFMSDTNKFETIRRLFRLFSICAAPGTFHSRCNLIPDGRAIIIGKLLSNHGHGASSKQRVRDHATQCHISASLPHSAHIPIDLSWSSHSRPLAHGLCKFGVSHWRWWFSAIDLGCPANQFHSYNLYVC